MSCVYALVLESAPNDFRYIGRTSEAPHRRLSKHLSAARTTDGAHLGRWIRKAWSESETIKIVVLEDELTFEESGIREIALIKQYRDEGFRLTNISAGGDGCLGNSGWKHTEEALAKMRGNKYCLGRKDSEETRKKKSLSAIGNKGRTGMKNTEEARAKMRGNKNGLGYKMTEEQKTKVGIRMTGNTNALGHKHSDETRAKMSEAQKGKKKGKMTEEQKTKIGVRMTGNTNALGHKWSDESRARLRKAKTGKKLSTETRAKMSASRLGHKRTPETRAKINATRTLTKLKKEAESKE